jgi:hypothetical protein
MCSSEGERKQVIQRVLGVSGSQVTLPGFRCLVPVQRITLGRVTGFSAIFDDCDMISIHCPIMITVCMSSTMFAVQKFRCEPFIPKSPFGDARGLVIQGLRPFWPLLASSQLRTGTVMGERRRAQ